MMAIVLLHRPAMECCLLCHSCCYSSRWWWWWYLISLCVVCVSGEYLSCTLQGLKICTTSLVCCVLQYSTDSILERIPYETGAQQSGNMAPILFLFVMQAVMETLDKDFPANSNKPEFHYFLNDEKCLTGQKLNQLELPSISLVSSLLMIVLCSSKAKMK